MPPGTRLVVRLPRFSVPGPSIIDRYISRIYVRVASVSFLALLGLFYISTFIDRSDKIFKGVAVSKIGHLLVLMTPQFVYYVIPIAALLSALVTYGLLARSSELTVMKACGISLYRTALSLVDPVARIQRHSVLARAAPDGDRQPPGGRARLPRYAAGKAEGPEPPAAPLGRRRLTERSTSTATSTRNGTRCSG